MCGPASLVCVLLSLCLPSVASLSNGHRGVKRIPHHQTNLRKAEQVWNRDRGKPRGSSPPTPPDMRVRIRRFRDLSPRGPEVRFAFRRWRLRRSQVPFGLHPIRPRQAPPKRIGWRMASMRAAHYYPRSRFGPSSVTGLLCPLLTSAARSRHLAAPSVTIP